MNNPIERVQPSIPKVPLPKCWTKEELTDLMRERIYPFACYPVEAIVAAIEHAVTPDRPHPMYADVGYSAAGYFPDESQWHPEDRDKWCELIAQLKEIHPDNEFAWPIYISALPDAPSHTFEIPTNEYDSILVCSTQGKSDNPKWLVDYPGITIIVASPDYDRAHKKAKAIDEILLGIKSVGYGPEVICQDPDEPDNRDKDKTYRSRITSITQNTPLLDLGRDRIEETQRCRFTLNYNLIVEPAPSPLSSRLPL